MKLHCLLTSFLLIASVGVATAQEPSPAVKEPVPDAPLMTTAPASVQWTITYTPKTPDKEPVTPDEIHDRRLRVRYSPHVISKRILKSAENQLVIFTTYEAGMKSEAWAVKDYFYEMPFREGDGVHMNPKGTGDFAEIYWVSAANFRGTVDYKGNKAHLYETDEGDTFVDPSAPLQARQKAQTEPVKSVHKRAYIDAKNRLPLAADLGDTTLTYQYASLTAPFPTPNDRVMKIMRDAASTKKR